MQAHECHSIGNNISISLCAAFQVIPIVGPCRVKELEESLRASEKRLTQEEVEFLFS